jgi:antitoxin component of MazEF toxin-antitoxin module
MNMGFGIQDKLKKIHKQGHSLTMSLPAKMLNYLGIEEGHYVIAHLNTDTNCIEIKKGDKINE